MNIEALNRMQQNALAAIDVASGVPSEAVAEIVAAHVERRLDDWNRRGLMPSTKTPSPAGAIFDRLAAAVTAVRGRGDISLLLSAVEEAVEHVQVTKAAGVPPVDELKQLLEFLKGVLAVTGRLTKDEREQLRGSVLASLKWAMELPKRACQQLYFAKWLSLGMAFAVVLVALCFTRTQLTASVRLADRAMAIQEKALSDTTVLRIVTQAKPGSDLAETKTDLKLEDGKASVNTSMVGVVVLVISLAFFFLYLKFVFPKDVPELGGGPAPKG